MPAWFSQLHPVAQALLAGVFTWFVAAGGAALVFFARSINRKLLDAMLGFSGGVMLAASYWSLLAPAIEISEHGALPAWLPASVGLLLGAAIALSVGIGLQNFPEGVAVAMPLRAEGLGRFKSCGPGHGQFHRRVRRDDDTRRGSRLALITISPVVSDCPCRRS